MTAPSNAELREAIEDILNDTEVVMDGNKVDLVGTQDMDIDKLIALFQDRERQLLTELLGEKIFVTRSTGDKNYNVMAVPVSVIQSKIGELNG